MQRPSDINSDDVTNSENLIGICGDRFLMRNSGPLVYTVRSYRIDLAVFCETAGAPPESGPFYCLCGWTMENLLKNHERFADPVGFMCVQYALNLLDQGIYCHFPRLIGDWRRASPPFLDLRACHAGHGGLSGRPQSILWFVRERWTLPDAESVDWDRCVFSYLRFFLDQYLPAALPELPVAQLLQALVADPDCSELRGLMGLGDIGPVMR